MQEGKKIKQLGPYFIIILLIVINLYQLVRLNFLNGINKKLVSETELFKNNLTQMSNYELFHYANNGLTIKNDSLSKLSINNNSHIVILRYFDSMCSACGDSLLSQLKYIQSVIHIKRLIIFTGSNEKRNLMVLLINKNVRDVEIQELPQGALNNYLDKNAVSYFFIFDRELKYKELFIPDKYFANRTFEYFKLIKNKYSL
jgi:hypothetical protein